MVLTFGAAGCTLAASNAPRLHNVVFKAPGNHTGRIEYISRFGGASRAGFYIAGAADAHGSTPRGTPLGSVSRGVRVWSAAATK